MRRVSQSLPLVGQALLLGCTAYVHVDTSSDASSGASSDASSGTSSDASSDATLEPTTTTTTTAQAQTYSVGGTVTGLIGTGLVLSLNGEQLIVSGDGEFTFTTMLEAGLSYTVTVKTQPSDPSQTCTVTNGSGTIEGVDVDSVAIACGIVDCVDIATLTADIHTRYLDTFGTHLFIAAGEQYGQLRIVDVSQPERSTPTVGELSFTMNDGCYYGGGVKVAPGGDIAFLYGGGCDGLRTVDVSDRAAPLAGVVVGGLSAGTLDLEICGDMAYVVVQSVGVAAFDISDPSAPVLRDEYVIDGGTYPYAVTCRSRDANTDVVYLGDGGDLAAPAGLRSFEYSKASQALTPRGSYLPDPSSWGGRGWPLSDELLYLSWSNSTQLATFDVSDLDNIPAPTTVPGVAGSNAEMLVLGDFLITSGLTGLAILDISTPTMPALRYHRDMINSIVGLAHFTSEGQDYLAYTLNGEATISICRLALP
ncbi:MAG: hypothetical protein IPO88_32270 [Nannocystis sp.]|uniref:LVIVD repeat-containing protein n=1 Tax=Nannocystis sp. TaxID=1962667 RepID=UPI00242279A1|nr:hypothetical protein [Nannocystis sp.]MBK9758111.1 hypothetical protein [Nannocystis sp.]